MINSRDLDDLHPVVKEMAEQFIEKCTEAGITVLITATYRDKEYQDSLYAKGRTAPGAKVTNAKGGQSMHNYRVAFDFVPMVNRTPAWDDEGLFKRCGSIASECGLEWGGNWKTFKDMPHCQYTNGLTLADFQNGKTLGSNHV